MKNWLKNQFQRLVKKRITQTKVREAYLIRDSKYLRRAYKTGSDYLKPSIVSYLGEIPTQGNIDFLLQELKTVKLLQLKTSIYVSTMNLALYDSLRISDRDSELLYQNLNLLDNLNFDLPTQEIKKLPPEPIPFRNKLKDHLELLEKMREGFHTF